MQCRKTTGDSERLATSVARERDFVIVTESLGLHRLNSAARPSVGGNQPPGIAAPLRPLRWRQSFGDTSCHRNSLNAVSPLHARLFTALSIYRLMSGQQFAHSYQLSCLFAKSLQLRQVFALSVCKDKPDNSYFYRK